MIGRRSLLAGILGAAAAPAIVKAESLMKIIVPQQRLREGEFGAIDDWLYFDRRPSLSPSCRYAAQEMLRMSQPTLSMIWFSRASPLPVSLGKTIKFRRYAGPILIPSSPLHDLIHGDRKTA